jgi:hypothetical protein
MKRLFVMLLLITPLFAGCIHHDQVVGSNNRQRQKREISAFKSISTEGAYEIQVVSQQALGLEIEGDDNILPLISTDVTSGVLRIKSIRSISTKQPIVVKITTPDLEGVSASGAGSIEVSGVKNERFLIDSSGAPSIRVSGETKKVEIEANGAGRVDAHRLRAAIGSVEANGVAKIEVNATDELNVSVSGPASVTYSGSPKLNKSVNGPGSVQRRASEGA